MRAMSIRTGRLRGFEGVDGAGDFGDTCVYALCLMPYDTTRINDVFCRMTPHTRKRTLPELKLELLQRQFGQSPSAFATAST